MDALIGYSGFVGSNLSQQAKFGARFNSKTIGEAVGRSFGTVVCAAAPGSMFDANRFPNQDAGRVRTLQDQISRIQADHFVLISSIAVLADFASGETEETTAFQSQLAYGRHRRELEAFCQDRFPRCLVVRLPALFGPGLKKNFLFDMMNPAPSMLSNDAFEMTRSRIGSVARVMTSVYAWSEDRRMHVLDRDALAIHEDRYALEAELVSGGLSASRFTHPESTFQFYDVRGLWADVQRASEAGLNLVHICPEPVEAREVHRNAVGRDMHPGDARVHHEDMRTLHAHLWGRSGPYAADRSQVLRAVDAFIRAEVSR